MRRRIETLAERVEVRASDALTRNEASSYVTSLEESMAARYVASPVVFHSSDPCQLRTCY
jgi:hypothetical protein